MAIFGVTASHAKYLSCDLSTPVMMEPYYIVVPWPKEESRLLAPIRPFQPEVNVSQLLYFIVPKKLMIRTILINLYRCGCVLESS
jgi:hypothetical protein